MLSVTPVDLPEAASLSDRRHQLAEIARAYRPPRSASASMPLSPATRQRAPKLSASRQRYYGLAVIAGDAMVAAGASGFLEGWRAVEFAMLRVSGLPPVRSVS